MTELAEWLKGVLDEDEQLARAAEVEAASPWRPDGGRILHSGPVLDYMKEDQLWDSEGCAHPSDRLCMTEHVTLHVALHDPRTVLADIASKRALLDTYEYFIHESEHGPDPCASSMLAALASAYASRPGYDPSWAAT